MRLSYFSIIVILLVAVVLVSGCMLEYPLTETETTFPQEVNEISLLWKYDFLEKVKNVAISSKGDKILVSTENEKLYLFDKDKKILWNKTINNFFSEYHDIDISGDGNFVFVSAIGSFAKPLEIIVYDINGTIVHQYNKELNDMWGSPIYSSNDGEHLLVGGEYWIYLFDKNGTKQWEYRTGDDIVDVSISPDSNYYAAASRDGYLYFFDKKGTLLWDKKIKIESNTKLFLLSNHKIAIQVWSEGIYLLNETDGETKDIINIDDFSHVAVSSDGEYILSSKYLFDIGPLLMLRNKEGVLLGKYSDFRNKINEIDISEDGCYFAVVSDDGNLYLFQRISDHKVKGDG